MSESYRDRRAALAAIAKETKTVLPDILQQLPFVQATASEKLNLDELPPLDPADCPKFILPGDTKTYGTKVVVVNEDTFDAALAMPKTVAQQQHVHTAGRNQRVVVLNLASDKTPGGGWLGGSAAQEEALCYRSSLSLSLQKSYYPWAPLTGIYTRDVLIIRASMGDGHMLLAPQTAPADLPVVSVISAAGLRHPPVEGKAFKFAADRNLAKAKMRLVLRIAANEKHELLVLGAIGCGAFKNPPEDVATCW